MLSALCFPSPHARSSCSSSSSSSSSSDVLPMYYSRVVYSFTLPLVCVCVCTLYHPHARWKEWRCVWKLFKQTMRSFVLSTYTLKPYGIHPSNFKSRGFFVFSFFCFFLRYGHSVENSRLWNTTERERERETKNKLPFFHSFLFWGGQTFFWWGEWILLSSFLFWRKCSNLKWNSWPEKTTRGSPAFVDHEKTALCDCI